MKIPLYDVKEWVFTDLKTFDLDKRIYVGRAKEA